MITYLHSIGNGRDIHDKTLWYPGRPIQITSSWSANLFEWGIPFEGADGDHLQILRDQDARAFDAARRIPIPGTVSISERARTRLVRATFEQARRDQKFLAALEAVLVARFYSSLEPEAVIRFVEQQIPEPYELLWQRDLRVEEAMAAVVAAARRLDSDGAGPINTAIAQLDVLLAARSSLDEVGDVMEGET